MEKGREKGGGPIGFHYPALEAMQHHLCSSHFWSRQAQNSSQIHGEGKRLYPLVGRWQVSARAHRIGNNAEALRGSPWRAQSVIYSNAGVTDLPLEAEGSPSIVIALGSRDFWKFT